MNDRIDIIYKSIKTLKPYANNPRKNDDAVEYVANSINEFGFRVPIVIDRNNVIVCGHTRYKAAKKLGINELPCVVADDLTEEQINAFRLADNKVSEKAEWDFELLDAELEGIELDMEDFGFEFDYNSEIKKEQNAKTTQGRVENILNLGYAQFESENKYDIPSLAPVFQLPRIDEWIGFNYVLSDNDTDEQKLHKAVHFFVDDYQFERVWTNPDKYIEYLKKYGAVCTPDFSPYGDMPLATQIFNHYRKHWVGAYWQKHGITVIPTIRKSTDERSGEFYLEGEPHNGIVIISNMWAGNYMDGFMNEYCTMVNELNPKKIYVYGKEMDLPGNTEFIKSFAQARFPKGEKDA